MNFSFIFIGTTHRFIDDFIKQKEIILKIKPEFILCEELENLVLDSKEKFKKLFKKRTISNMTTFEELENLIRLCFNNNIKLIGIDLKNFGFNKNLQNKIKNKECLSPEEEKKVNDILILREKKHVNNILRYRKKTNLTIIIIIGCWHLRKGSLLRNKIKDYKLIVPYNEKDRPLLGPSKFKKVKYKEIIPNDN